MISQEDIEIYAENFVNNEEINARLLKARDKIDSFYKQFPKDSLRTLTLDDYCLGRSKGFSWWLEFGSYEFGRIGAYRASIHIVYYDKKRQVYIYPRDEFKSENEALEYIKKNLVEIVDLTEKEDFSKLSEHDFFNRYTNISGKTAFLYNTDKILPIYSEGHLDNFLKMFNLIPHESESDIEDISIIKKNLLLREFFKGIPIFNDWETYKIMWFVYDLKSSLDSIDAGDESDSQVVESISERIKETEIQKIIVNNINGIDWKLGEEVKLIEGQFDTKEAGKIDLLLEGESNYYVVELKSGTASEAVIGQILRYIGYLQRTDYSRNKSIKGIVLAEGMDENLRNAIIPIGNIVLFRKYKLSVQIEAP